MGNGGIGDKTTFAYAVGDNYCEQIDLGIDSGGYKLKHYLPQNMQETKNIDSIKNYTIEVDGDSIQVYKNGNAIFIKSISHIIQTSNLKEDLSKNK